MSKLTLILLAAAAVTCLAEDKTDICVCKDKNSEVEKHEVFDFLRKFSGNEVPEKYAPYAVVNPNVLSPLVQCGNCIEQNRRKRKIFPDSDAVDSDENMYEGMHLRSRKCPVGYAKIGFLCLSSLLEK